jgi:SRSO17 transposase
MLHFISQGGWSEDNVLGKVCELVVPEMERHGPIEAWIIDDTGFPKQGKHSLRANIVASLVSKTIVRWR